MSQTEKQLAGNQRRTLRAMRERLLCMAAEWDAVDQFNMSQLTNFRVSGKEDAIKITPPIELTLEYAVEFIADDELVEITPKSIRLRKRFLKEHERKRASRE